MEGYPSEYFTTPLPLLILSGLGNTEDYTELPPYPSLENGTLINSELAPVTSNIGQQLLEQFKAFSGQEKWVGTLKRGGRPPNSPSFKIISVGRNFVLPPKKASPPPPSTPSSPFVEHDQMGAISRMLHSPISPLTPESPLYPDGIFTHIWLRKHLSLLPCAFVSVHEFYIANPPSSTEEDAADNVLIGSINEMKKNLAADHRKAKFAVILISPKSILEVPSIEDRFSHIRRSTQLDTKTSLFFLPPGLSVVELQQFAKTVEMALVPSAIDYYRELTKHARRKRNRGSVPPPTLPPTQSSQALTNVEWTVRYEIKLATFAEFRGEMDVAARNYETAYEGLMEVFETTNTWSTRWNDARVLADVVAAKVIRCHIFLENTTIAARRWAVHKKRMGDVVDRKGAGTNTYGWAAWSTRWAEIMATIVADSGILSSRNRDDTTHYPVYAPIDKTIKVDDRVAPIEFLHHPGFYWLMSANAAKLRRRRAQRLAVSDTATETYMCPPPEEETHVDHVSLIVKPLEKATAEFDERKQHRMKCSLAFDTAILLMEQQEWKRALQLLKSGLKHWRSESWLFAILQEALWRIRDCAVRCGDIASVVMTDLELHADVFDTRKNWKYDLANCLADVDGVVGTTSLFVRAADIIPLVAANYTFDSPEVCVGDSAVSQVSVTYRAQPGSEPLTFSELKLAYEGNLKPVVIKHKASSSPVEGSSIQLVNLQGKLQDRTTAIGNTLPSPKSFLQGTTDLTFAPGQTKVFQISAILRDSGTAKVASLTMGIEGHGFDVDLMLLFDDVDSSDSRIIGGAGNAIWWEESDEGGSLKKVPMRLDSPRSLIILPKPPKMDLDIEKLMDPLYLDEPVKVKINITNNEEDEAFARLRVRILGYPDEVPLVHWDPADGKDDVECDPETPYEIGSVAPSQELFRAFTFPAPVQEADITLEIAALYHLVSDKETPIVKTVVIPQVRVRQPFKAKYDFSQSIHLAPWPNYFTLNDEDLETEEDEKSPRGIVQKWCLKSTFGLAEGGSLTVEDILCDIVACQGGVVCTVERPEGESKEATILEGETPMDSIFYIDVRKISLEDRRVSSLDIELRIKWRRQGGELVQTSLAIPRLMIPGSEPRVLAHASISTQILSLVHLTYIIENPTMHVLTFGITMEANDAFAFSGPKQLGIQLMPLSRHIIRYNLMPLQRNAWIRPSIRIVDKYYNKNLRIAACEGTKPDKGQVLVWVP